MRLGLLAALAVLPVACSELDDVPRDRCGNGVIEPDNGEDCDPATGLGASGCGLPDTATACRVLCDPAAPACPGTAACGLDGVCHAPGGELVAAASLAWTAPHLLVVDTSGDDYPELVGVSNQQVEVRLGGPDLGFGALPVIPSPPLTGEPHAADLEGDGDLDITLPVAAGVFTLAGDPSTALDPFFYNSFPSPAFGRMAGVGVTFADLLSVPVIAAHDLESGVSVLVVPGAEEGAAVFPTGRTVDELVGDTLPVGSLIDGSLTVRNLALIFDSGRAISLYDLDVNNLQTVRITARTAPVMLPASTRVLHGAWFADLDGDGHQDLVASVEQGGVEGLAVAWGNGNGALADSLNVANQATVVWRADRDQDGDGQPDGPLIPLHVAQVTDNLVILGDENDADIIARDGLYTTLCAGLRAQCGLYRLRTSLRAWSGATVADVNGDDRPDVIAFAAGQTGLDLLLNTATTLLFNDATVTTSAAVERLFTGDFNGDTITDVAYVDASPGVPFTDALSVSFGAYLEPPGPAVFMGSVGELVLGGTLLAAGTGGVFDFIDDMIMVTDREVDGATVRGAAIAFGSSARRLVAPLLPADLELGERAIQQTRTDEVLPLLGDGDAYADLAVLTTTRYGSDTTADSQPVTVQHARFFSGASDGQAEELGAVPFDPDALEITGALWRAADVVGGDREEAIGILADGRLLVLELDPACMGLDCATQVEAPPGVLADPVNAGAADADGDGDLDLYAAFRNRGGSGAQAALIVWWNDGGFSGARTQRFDGPISDGAIVDRDRDGTAELLVLHKGTKGLQVATYTAGGFTELQRLVDTVDGVALHAADVNGDALVDLVVVSGVERETPRELTVYLQTEARL